MPDTLEHTVLFLQKRDGIDKARGCMRRSAVAASVSQLVEPPVEDYCCQRPQVLKLLRYSAKIACVTALKGSDTDLAQQLRSFEASLGTTRRVARRMREMMRSHLRSMAHMSAEGRLVVSPCAGRH